MMLPLPRGAEVKCNGDGGASPAKACGAATPRCPEPLRP
eukprot:CAMPEP_0176222274 /NCGR_PEP_ID=MMETSP0121_2-20121125/20151_1 /TAXON_ID=160619 /ORGANISM="Kryptoperidinium foliaceum, Strain CCMP 1326" /LENGTH=38 /DNA_ID= /DNA_START= /DNA_END= /DNA_ORIENTATION=